MDIVGKVIPASAPVPGGDNLACVLVQRDQTLAVFGADAEDGGQIICLGADPFFEGARHGLQRRGFQILQGQGGFPLDDGDLLAVAPLELGDEHHHQPGDGQGGQEGDHVKSGVEVPAPGGEVEFLLGRAGLFRGCGLAVRCHVSLSMRNLSGCRGCAGFVML